MRVAIAGGKLQGVEAAYLARQAGWEVVLLDRDPLAPAAGLCDLFCQADLTRAQRLPGEAGRVDLIIPALEDREVLASLVEISRRSGIPLAFDPSSYQVSSSKLTSDRLFSRWGVPAPRPWPQAGFPLVAKPSGASGSQGVQRLNSQLAYEYFLAGSGDSARDWVFQEYLEGPSFSLEVMGCGGEFRSFQTTRLEMDLSHDCKRVLAPAGITPGEDAQFRRISEVIARNLNLTGIMDVEVIQSGGVFRVLEIDARLPSQTPTAVYRSTGVNLLELLAGVFLKGELPQLPGSAGERGVVYEHLRVSPGVLEVCGEHIMSGAGPLGYCRDFFGADEAITSWSAGAPEWVATLICSGPDLTGAWHKRCAVIREIMRHCSLEIYSDASPEGMKPFFDWS